MNMATATKRPKKQTKKLIAEPRTARAKKAAAKPSTNGAAKSKTAGPGKFAAEQEPLHSMEDVDLRYPALDEWCQRYFAAKDKILTGREGTEEALDKVGHLLREHELECYILNGKKFYIEPSKSSVKVKKVKQQ
jgi:hypothetical protein